MISLFNLKIKYTVIGVAISVLATPIYGLSKSFMAKFDTATTASKKFNSEKEINNITFNQWQLLEKTKYLETADRVLARYQVMTTDETPYITLSRSKITINHSKPDLNFKDSILLNWLKSLEPNILKLLDSFRLNTLVGVLPKGPEILNNFVKMNPNIIKQMNQEVTVWIVADIMNLIYCDNKEAFYKTLMHKYLYEELVNNEEIVINYLNMRGLLDSAQASLQKKVTIAEFKQTILETVAFIINTQIYPGEVTVMEIFNQYKNKVINFQHGNAISYPHCHLTFVLFLLVRLNPSILSKIKQTPEILTDLFVKNPNIIEWMSQDTVILFMIPDLINIMDEIDNDDTLRKKLSSPYFLEQVANSENIYNTYQIQNEYCIQFYMLQKLSINEVHLIYLYKYIMQEELGLIHTSLNNNPETKKTIFEIASRV